MKDPRDLDRARQDAVGAMALPHGTPGPLRELADADRPLRLQRKKCLDEVAVTRIGELAARPGVELVEREVATGSLEEHQRTVVEDEPVPEERRRRAEATRGPAP